LRAEKLRLIPIVLGRYRLDEQVGQGGMAVVWRGYDTQLKRTVAVKVLHQHLLVREEMRRRFGREAQAVARLHHPHILDIYDFSGPEAQPSYLVTEFIPGWSLRSFAEAHPFDPPELAAACGVALAEALEHAHAANVVHRDLKPENVMIREDGQIKLTDFGIAALLDPDEKLTATGAILGSPAHLSPETIEGKPADPRSDLFSLGTVLYWLACGELPFQAKTPAALLRQILEGHAPDPRTLRPSISDSFAQVITHLLERDPAKRTPSAAAAKQELWASLAESGIDDPARELTLFVQHATPGYAAHQLRDRLVAHHLQLGEQAIRARRTAAALSAYSRVLALEPGNEAATKEVTRIRNRTRTLKRAKAVGAGLGLLVAAAQLVDFAGKRAAAHRVRQDNKPAPIASVSKPAPDAAASTIPPKPVAPIAAPATPISDPPANPLHPNDRPAQASVDARETTPIRPRHLASLHESANDPRLGRAQSVLATLSVHWVWAHVLVDGVDLGEAQTFTRQLPVGPHVVIVSHACCLDQTQTIDVEPEQTRYALEPGKPRPAKLKVRGAPSDAPVLIDGVSMGPSQNLATHELPMTDRPSREVLLTVGDHSGKVTLEAGRTNEIDYLKLASAP